MAAGRTGLIAAAAVGAVGAALVQGVREMESADQSLRRLKATGAASGLTAGQLAALADEMETGTLATAEGVMDASAVMATFRSVSGDTFTRAIRLAQDLSAVFRVLAEARLRAAEQTRKVLDDLQRELSAPWQPRQAATDRAEAARLAGDLFEQKQALEELQRALKEEADARARGKELVRQHRTAEQDYADTLRELNDLLAQGALDADTHARAIEAATTAKLAAGDLFNTLAEDVPALFATIEMLHSALHAGLPVTNRW